MLEDKDMRFDKEEEMYCLTLDYVQNRMHQDLNAVLVDEFDTNTSTMAEDTIKYASAIVYDWLFINCGNYEDACNLIKNNEKWFKKFKRALSYQLYSLQLEGDKGIQTDDDLNKLISVRTKQILYRLTRIQNLRRRNKVVPLDSSYYVGDPDGGIY